MVLVNKSSPAEDPVNRESCSCHVGGLPVDVGWPCALAYKTGGCLMWLQTSILAACCLGARSQLEISKHIRKPPAECATVPAQPQKPGQDRQLQLLLQVGCLLAGASPGAIAPTPDCCLTWVRTGVLAACCQRACSQDRKLHLLQATASSVWSGAQPAVATVSRRRFKPL